MEQGRSMQPIGTVASNKRFKTILVSRSNQNPPSELEVCLRKQCECVKVVSQALNGAHILIPPASTGEVTLAVRVYYATDLSALASSDSDFMDSSPGDDEIEGLYKFQNSFALTLVFFVLSEEEEDLHLGNMESFVNRAIFGLALSKSGGSSNNTTTRTMLVGTSDEAVETLIHFADALTPAKRKFKHTFFENERKSNLIPPFDDQSYFQQEAVRRVTEALRNWARRNNIREGDADVLMATMGSLENLVEQAAIGLPTAPVEKRTKKLLYEFFHGQGEPEYETAMASEPGYTRTTMPPPGLIRQEAPSLYGATGDVQPMQWQSSSHPQMNSFDHQAAGGYNVHYGESDPSQAQGHWQHSEITDYPPDPSRDFSCGNNASFEWSGQSFIQAQWKDRESVDDFGPDNGSGTFARGNNARGEEAWEHLNEDVRMDDSENDPQIPRTVILRNDQNVMCSDPPQFHQRWQYSESGGNAQGFGIHPQPTSQPCREQWELGGNLQSFEMGQPMREFEGGNHIQPDYSVPFQKESQWGRTKDEENMINSRHDPLRASVGGNHAHNEWPGETTRDSERMPPPRAWIGGHNIRREWSGTPQNQGHLAACLQGGGSMNYFGTSLTGGNRGNHEWIEPTRGQGANMVDPRRRGPPNFRG